MCTSAISVGCCSIDYGSYVVLRSVVEASSPILRLASGSDLTTGNDSKEAGCRPYTTTMQNNGGRDTPVFSLRMPDAAGTVVLSKGAFSDVLIALFGLLGLRKQLEILSDKTKTANKYKLMGYLDNGGELRLADVALLLLHHRVKREFVASLSPNAQVPERHKPNEPYPAGTGNAREAVGMTRFPVIQELLALQEAKMSLPGAAVAFEAASEDIAEAASCLCMDGPLKARLAELAAAAEKVRKEIKSASEGDARAKNVLKAWPRLGLELPLYNQKNPQEVVTNQPTHASTGGDTYRTMRDGQVGTWGSCSTTLETMTKQKAEVQQSIEAYGHLSHPAVFVMPRLACCVALPLCLYSGLLHVCC